MYSLVRLTATLPMIPVRLRLKKSDLYELVKLYRLGAAEDRRRSEDCAFISAQVALVESARTKDNRATKLEELAKKSDDFILMGTRPFNGGPPSLLIVGGSKEPDGSALVTKRTKRG
jgi:hypothetical protein